LPSFHYYFSQKKQTGKEPLFSADLSPNNNLPFPVPKVNRQISNRINCTVKLMDYKIHLSHAIACMENNLKHAVNITDCAHITDYSDYHFLRVFKFVTGDLRLLIICESGSFLK